MIKEEEIQILRAGKIGGYCWLRAFGDSGGVEERIMKIEASRRKWMAHLR